MNAGNARGQRLQTPVSEPWRTPLPDHLPPGAVQVVVFWPETVAAPKLMLHSNGRQLTLGPVGLDHPATFLFELADGSSGDVTLTSETRPLVVLFHSLARTVRGASGLGVFPKCLTSATAERAPPPPFDSATLDAALERGDLDATLEMFGDFCVADHREAIVAASRKILTYIAEHPLRRVDRVGMFISAIASVRS